MGIVESECFKAEWIDALAPFHLFLTLKREAGRVDCEGIEALLAERGLGYAVIELPDD